MLLISMRYLPGSSHREVLSTRSGKTRPMISNRIVDDGYFKNFNNTMKADENNNISFKIIYFLDYLQFKSKLKKKGKMTAPKAS